MSRGKYSPNLPRGKEFIYNCYAEVPTEWSKEVAEGILVYDEKTMFVNYDDEGYDSYGYSAFDRFGTYSGIGGGVDRNGYTEYEYLCMTELQWEDAQWNLTTNRKPDTIHVLTLKQENKMARETKAQRDARLEAERLARVEVAKATYTERMMAVFARATKMNFDLDVKDAKFVVHDRDSNYREVYSVDPVWSELADSDLYSLEMAVEFKEEVAAERERKANLRATALAKLTAEEREALSL
jgi:predicted nucleic acid-binding protein